MSIESESQNIYYLSDTSFTACQFVSKCKLLSHHFPHKIPNWDDICSDYLSQQEISESNISSELMLNAEDLLYNEHTREKVKIFSYQKCLSKELIYIISKLFI